jgi:hypothetical protein
MRVVCELEVREQVLDFHALEELVAANDSVWDAFLLQCRFENTREGVVTDSPSVSAEA